MKNLYGKEFEEYQEKTPFMIPLLKKTNILSRVPLRIFLKKKPIDKRKDIFIIIIFYAVILMFISFLFSLYFGRGKILLYLEERIFGFSLFF